MATIFAEPDYTITYEPDVLDTFPIIASTQVNAYQSADGSNHNLTLGASSNVEIEALEGVNIYYDEDKALTLYNTTMSNNIRTDTPILQVSHTLDTTYIQSSDLKLYLSGLDADYTTKISKTLLSSSNLKQVIQTDLDSFDIRAPLYISSNLDVSYDVVSHNNIACSGNMFSASVNLYRNRNNSSNTQVAFGFFINEHDQLELVKFNKYEVDNVVTTETKRVATFGKSIGSGVGELSNYVALNEFNGIIGQSNGNTPEMTNMLWGSQSGTSNVYYIAGNVGVGTATPSERLHVKDGNLKVGGHILPDSNLTYDLGSSNLRFRDIYLSGNTINLAGATISVNETGTITMNDTTGAPPIDLSELTSNADSALAIAIAASNAVTDLSQAAIDSNGIAFSSNTAIASSNNTFALSNYVHGANKTTLLWASNNLVKNTGGNVTGTLSATQIGVGQVSPSEKLEVVGNIKSTSNIYAASRVGIATSNPTHPLHVIGNARIEGNLDVTGIYNTITTDVKVTDQFSVSNNGTGPALKVYQMGAQAIADFYDDSNIAVRIADGGLVGIGKSIPAYNLDVLGDINFTGNLLWNGEVFTVPTGGGSSVWWSASNRVFLMSSNVGIGVSNPKLPLDVNGDIRTTSNVYAMNRLGVGLSNPAYPLDVNGDINFTGTFRQNGIPYIGSQWSNSDSNVFLFGSNVGLGKSNPATPLDVAGTVTATTFAGPTITSLMNLGWYGSNTANFGSNTAVAASNTAIFGSNVAVSASNTAASATATAVSGCNAAVFSSNLAVWSSNNLLNKAGGTITGSLDVTSNVTATSNVYAMRRLGVGTSNPTVPLHVIGDARIEGNLNVNGIYNTINTDVQVTDQFTVSNNGTGPALKVHQMGAQAIADFYDDSNLIIRIADGGLIGIGNSNPRFGFDANIKMRLTGNVSNQTHGPRLQIDDIDGQTDANTYGIAQICQNGASPAFSNQACLSFIRSGNWVTGLGFNRGSNVFGIGQAQGSNVNFTPNMLCVNQSGFVGVGTMSPTNALHVAGSVFATGDVTAYSDARAKSNLLVIETPLDKISQLTGYTYEFTESNLTIDKNTKITERFTGILAQDLAQVLPEAVHTNEQGQMSIAYGNMAGLFVEAIKELKLEVQTLKERVRLLEEAAAAPAPRTRAKRTTKKATATAATE